MVDGYAERFPSVEFRTGPAGAYFEQGGNRFIYTTLCSEGEKPEGATPNAYPTAAEAWGRYWAVLQEFLGGTSRQVAWRAEPTLCQRDDGFYVRSRLVVTNG